MATKQQQLAFIQQWSPYATSAGKQLGISPSYVLAQWGMESGWGTQPNMGKNNPGNVGNLGGGKWQDYTSPDQFVSTYVASMKNDFTWFKETPLQRIEHGQGIVANITAIFGHQTPGHGYDPANPSYWKNVGGAYTSLLLTTGQSNKSIDAYIAGQSTVATKIAGALDNANNAVTQPFADVGTAIGNFGKSLTDNINRAGLVLGAIVLAILGVFLLVKGEVPNVANNVQRE